MNELREVQRATRSGATLIKKLLAFSRREELSLEPLDLSQLVAGLGTTLRRLLPESIEVEIHPAESLGIVSADPHAIEQILLNLATNARDAMPDGGLLRLETTRVRLDDTHCATHGWGKPGDFVCVVVSDTGAGMDEATKQRIFEPFFTTKPAGQGTGLGMAMIYGIVRQHDGFVHVKSEVGSGTTLKVYLPVTSECAGQAQTKGPAQQAWEAHCGTETILVAEDEASIRRAAKRVLEKSGYRVLTAEDGAEGIRMFRKHQDEIALVISDVVMPRVGGPELLQAVRAETEDTRFIFMSGHAAGQLETVGDVDPTVPFLNKPWTVTELVTQVRETLDQ